MSGILSLSFTYIWHFCFADATKTIKIYHQHQFFPKKFVSFI